MTVLQSFNFDSTPLDTKPAGLVAAAGSGHSVKTAASISRPASSGANVFASADDTYSTVYTASGAIGDQGIQFEQYLPTLATLSANGAVLRSNSTGLSAYVAFFETSGTALRVRLMRNNTGSTDLITPTGYIFTPSPTDKIKMRARAVGTTISVWVWLNNTTMPTTPTLTVTDSGIATGYPGVRMNGAFAYAAIDNMVLTDGAGGEEFFDPAPDTTAPVLSSPTGAATGNTTASATVSTDEGAGTIWCLTNTAATATASAVKAGTSQAVTATGVQTFASRTGLTADTLYYNHFVQDDAAGTPNTSAVVNSASFRTTGAVTFSGPVPTRNGVVSTAASFANASFFASAFTLTYTLQAGTLPAGLTLGSSTGIISGTPTTAGTSSGIVIRATDTNSNTADTNTYSIVIAATNASPTFPGTISNISGTAGSAITPVNVSGQFSDTDALTYTASPAGTAWPSALVVNSSTGIISGTVAGAGTTTGLKVRATDTASQTVDSNAFNAVIAAAPANPTVDIVNDLGQRVALSHGQGALPLVSVPGKVQFLSKTNLTAAPLANVSKTTNTDGTLTPWAQAGLTSGVLVTLRWISDADGHEGYYDVTPT